MVSRSHPGGSVDAALLPVRASVARRSTTLVGIFIALVALVCHAGVAEAVSGDVRWSKTWNTTPAGTVVASQAAARPGGGLYVAATVLRASGNLDIVVIRYSRTGARRWVRSYDGRAHRIDLMRGLAVDDKGNALVCGSSQSARGREDWVVLKYSPDGRRRWRRTLAGAARGPDEPSAIAVDARGAAVVVGTIARRATGGDWCVAKYSAGGRLLWRTTMSRRVAGLDQATAVAVDPGTRHVYVTGRMYGSRTGDDVVTVRYRPDGRRVWRQLWDGDGGPDRGVSIAVSRAGVAVAGVAHHQTTGDDGLVLRYRKSGVPRWAQVVDGGQGASAADRLHAVGIDDGGSVYAAGGITTSAAQGMDFAVVRFSGAGAPAGMLQIPAPGADDAALALHVTPTGTAFAAGAADDDRGTDALIVGARKDLSALWPAVWYDRAGDEQAQSLALASGSVYVAGVSGRDLLVLRIAR